MEIHIKHLIKLLRILADLHGILIQICEQKRDALVESRIQDLGNIIEEEEKVAAKLHQVEQQRLALIGEMHNRYYQNQKVISLSTIIQFATQPYKQELTHARTQLLAKVNDLKSVNDLNKTLCKQSLSTVTYYFNVLTTAVEKNPARYDMHARETEPSHYNLLDRTA